MGTLERLSGRQRTPPWAPSSLDDGGEAPRKATGEQEQTEGCLNPHGLHPHAPACAPKIEADSLLPPHALTRCQTR